MKKITTIVAILAAQISFAEMVTLPAPIQWETQITQISKPVPVKNSANHWESIVIYDVRDQVVYNQAGSINRVKRLAGEMTLEISAQEIMYLRGLTPTNTFAAGEWEEHVLQAGYMKAYVLSIAGAQRDQYELYWNQVIYNPTPVVQPITDANGIAIVGWQDGTPIIGYGELVEGELQGEPVLGVNPVDANGATILGYWNGQIVIGYDPLGFPLFGE